VARRAGIPTEEAYRQLEALAQRGDLDRRFELISPTTGRSLVEYRLGDTVPSGCVYEPEYEDEEPFVITDNDIWITFAPTATLRTRVEHKKKLPIPPQGELKRLSAEMRAAVETIRQQVEAILGKIRSEVERRHTASK
jgi:hypothetical protein